ncbi:uncharacterized protein beat-Vc isoform X3 [Drosophila bipectinata]|uniref:uncharacterized protein beat-Vc isoform X3 n=1 Tax=Drosophila bipectinata TaxID=42026 RepID=UPI0038B24637
MGGIVPLPMSFCPSWAQNEKLRLATQASLASWPRSDVVCPSEKRRSKEVCRTSERSRKREVKKAELKTKQEITKRKTKMAKTNRIMFKHGQNIGERMSSDVTSRQPTMATRKVTSPAKRNFAISNSASALKALQSQRFIPDRRGNSICHLLKSQSRSSSSRVSAESQPRVAASSSIQKKNRQERKWRKGQARWQCIFAGQVCLSPPPSTAYFPDDSQLQKFA